MATREQVMTALLALIQGCATFQTVSRRNRSPESLLPAQTPALFFFEGSETYTRSSNNMPPKRTLDVIAVMYSDVGQDENAIPSQAINNALDQLDLKLTPDFSADGRFTLGGLVESCMIDGGIQKSPGDKTGKSLAIIPVKIVLP